MNAAPDYRQLALFHRTLAELCRAEMPLGRAFRMLEDDLERGRLKEAVGALAAEVEGGTPLPEAYRKRADAFPPLYAALVEAGIASGDLPGTLEEVARHASLRAETQARLRQALAWPLFSAAVIVAVGTFLLVFVAPKFLTIATSFDEVLSGMNVDVPFLGDPYRALGALLALVAAVGGVAFAIVWLRAPIEGGGLAARVPVVGPLRLYAALATFASTAALALRRGLSLARALELAAAATDDPKLRACAEASARAAAEGRALGDALRQADLLPPSLAWLVGAGEARGAAAEVLDDVAAIYRERLARATDRMILLVAPVAQIALGAVVLGFVLSFVSPIFVIASLVRSLS